MSANKKKLLILTPRFPYPVIGGDRLRIYQVCKSLSERFSLTLLSLCENGSEVNMSLPQDGVFDRVERVYLSRAKSYLNVLLALMGSKPLQVAYYQSSEFSQAVERLLPQHDGVLSHLIRCAEYAKGADKPIFLEMTDAISLNYSRVRQLKNLRGFKAQVYRIEADRLNVYERQIIDRFDLSILVSETDKKYLVGADHNKVIVCSNGVALDQLPFKDRRDSSPVIVYIGNMTSLQNLDACLFFARDVMPLLSQRLRVIFRVVGRISDSDAAKLRTFANVEVTGAVDSIPDAVQDARLGVCPVRLAAGVQNKVLEYMALGLPVVTSSIGLEGFSAQPEQDLLVADTPQAYVDAIVNVWNDEVRLTQLASNGCNYVHVHHQWGRRLAPLVDRISAILDKSA